jgi:CheY-like chemotaxis protein
VVQAASGAEALRLAAAGEPFGAVVCDLTMPDLTGMDVYEELQRIRPDLARRLVVISGGGVSERSRRFLEEAPVRKVRKPFSPATLRAEVAAVLTLPPE